MFCECLFQERQLLCVESGFTARCNLHWHEENKKMPSDILKIWSSQHPLPFNQKAHTKMALFFEKRGRSGQKGLDLGRWERKCIPFFSIFFASVFLPIPRCRVSFLPWSNQAQIRLLDFEFAIQERFAIFN